MKNLESFCSDTVQTVTKDLSECQQELANDEDCMTKISDQNAAIAKADKNKVTAFGIFNCFFCYVSFLVSDLYVQQFSHSETANWLYFQPLAKTTSHTMFLFLTFFC